MQILRCLDSLPVGTIWKPPRGGDAYKKVSPLSHLNLVTGELLFDKRLYGQDAEPIYVTEVQA